MYHLAYFYSLIICAASLSVWVFFPILLVLLLAKRKGMLRKYISTLKSMMSTEAEDDTSISKKAAWKLTAALLIVIVAAILPEPVISFSSEGQDAITDFENSFEIQYDRDYYFDIRLDAGGFLTVIRISDSD